MHSQSGLNIAGGQEDHGDPLALLSLLRCPVDRHRCERPRWGPSATAPSPIGGRCQLTRDQPAVLIGWAGEGASPSELREDVVRVVGGVQQPVFEDADEPGEVFDLQDGES